MPTPSSVNKITQYRPAFFEGFDNKVVEFETLEQLMAIPWVKKFAGGGDFYRFSINGSYLMAEYMEGREWWVCGILDAPVDGLTAQTCAAPEQIAVIEADRRAKGIGNAPRFLIENPLNVAQQPPVFAVSATRTATLSPDKRSVTIDIGEFDDSRIPILLSKLLSATARVGLEVSAMSADEVAAHSARMEKHRVSTAPLVSRPHGDLADFPE